MSILRLADVYIAILKIDPRKRIAKVVKCDSHENADMIFLNYIDICNSNR
jgi:hypothetical protein